MSKSYDFCRTIVTDPKRSSYTNRDWSNAKEINPVPIFDGFLHGTRKFRIDGYDNQKSEPISLNINIAFDSDGDFTYFTSNTSIHDGTLIFIRECLERCAMNVIAGSYDSRDPSPKNGDTINYTIGNFILLSEYDIDGNTFAPKDKRWMHERTTALLPLRCEINKRALRLCKCGGSVELIGGTPGYPSIGVKCMKCGGQWNMDTYSENEAVEKWGKQS